MTAATTDEKANGGEKAMWRRDQLRALVRAHQHLVEMREQLIRKGAPPNREIEHDLTEVAERITSLLSKPEEDRDRD